MRHNKFEQSRLKPRFKDEKYEEKTKRFSFDLIHYVDGKVKNSAVDQDIQDLFQTAHFDLVQNSTGGPDVIDLPDDTDTTDDDGPPPTPVPELLVLTGDLDNADGSEATQLYSATVNGNNVQRISSNTFKARGGQPFSVTLQATM